MALSKITTRALANDSVTADKVADNAITTDMVASGEIGVTDLADGAITNAKISATAAIAPSKIDMASVTALTMSGHLSGDTATFTGDIAINNGSPEFYFGTTGNHYNWMLAAQENLDQAFEISVGSQDTDYSNDTYSKVVTVKADGNMDLVTGGLKVGGTTVIDSSRNGSFGTVSTSTKFVTTGSTAEAALLNTSGSFVRPRIRTSSYSGTPETSLHFNQQSGESTSRDYYMGIYAINNANPYMYFDNRTGGPVKWQVNGSTTMELSTTGDFGINGTTVINASQVGFLNEKTRIGTGATYPTDNAQLYIQRSDNNPYIGFFSNDGSRNAYLQSVGSGAFYLNNAEGGGWIFNNSTSDVLSITNTGAILGTDKLQITPGGTNYTGSSNTFASGAAVEIYAETLNTSSLLIANNSGTAHTWFNYTNGNNYITGDASNNTGDTIFRTYTANPDNYSEKVFFKANGEVHIGGNGSENSTSSFSFMGTGGDSYLNFNMDGRASPVTSLNGAYIWSGQGASGDYRAGDLAIQSRSNESRSVHVVTGTTPTKRWSAHGNGDISQYKSAQHGYTYYTNAATIDTDFTAADGSVFEVVGYVNPNSGGSNYRDVFHGHIYIGYGWSGSALTHYAYFVMLTPPAREVYNSGSNASANDIDIVLNNNGTETTSVPQSDASNWNIRLKASNYNTTYGSGFGASITRKI